MRNFRFIAKLDIKSDYLVKGIRFEGVKKIGDPNYYSIKYYKDGVDELLYLDTVASLYNRNNLFNILKKATQNIFIPITVGGGIKSLGDVYKILNAGADRVAINSAAVRNPKLLKHISEHVGSSCLVLSVQLLFEKNEWKVFLDYGRERCKINAIEWIEQAKYNGAGEVLLTSIAYDGTLNGFDKKLLAELPNKTDLPIIYCGGISNEQNIQDIINLNNCNAVAIASALHYEKIKISNIKKNINSSNFFFRK